jgi:hypothetical protein
MFPAPPLLLLIIATTPAILVFDGPILYGAVMAAAAVLLAIIGIRIRPGEAGYLWSVIRPLAIVAAIPALWMLVQVLPSTSIGLANPIWQSAAAALGHPLAGTISIDKGATLIALARYLSIAALVFVTAAVAIDRRRAEWLLFALTAATTLVALIVLASACLGDLTFLSDYGVGQVGISATDGASLGVILAAAAAQHTFDRGKSRDQPSSVVRFPLAFLSSLVAIAICTLAVLVGASSQTYLAVICGVATLVVTIVIRRFRLGPWGYSAIAAVALVTAIAVIALQPIRQTTDWTLAFAARAPASLIAVTQRIAAETRWTGTGAGTFADILPIYQDINEIAPGALAPTAAAGIAVEMGRPFLWVILLAAIAFVVTLLRGALRRGRDSCYSNAGSSCAVVITLLAFGNAGLFNTAIAMIAAVTFGIAIAQSKSRSI